MRSDLAVSRHDSGGWVVKDPIGLNYALLDDAEYTILRLLDGRISLHTLLDNLRQKFPSRQLCSNDLAEFIRVLAGHQLIRQTTSGDHRRLHVSQTRGITGWVISSIANILRLQIPLFNPTSFISSTMPYVRFAFRREVIVAAGIVCMLAAAMVLIRFGELGNAVPNVAQFLGPQNIILVLSIFVGVKVLHEAGHAFTARHFGAECNECGIMLLVLTPVLYTNVTDTWTLGRRERLLVTAAGIMIELCIAAVCMLLWCVATDAYVRSILLNTMLLCSLNTVLFNGNPLLRFDGYFLLADWMKIPNLAARASSAVHGVVFQLFTGVVRPHHESKQHLRFLLLYGFAAMAYRVFLTLAILQLIRFVSRQWQLEIGGNVVSAVLLSGAVVMPLLKFAATVTSAENKVQYTRKSFLRMAASVGCVLLLLLFPFPESIVAPAIVEPDSPPLYAPLPGQIQPMVAYGERVTKNQTVAVLHNSELQRKRQTYESRIAELDIQLQVLLRNISTANSPLIPSLRQSVQAAQGQQAAFAVELQRLNIVSLADGIFLPPPATEPISRSDLPKQWSGTPVDAQNTDSWIERGTLLGYVGDPRNAKLVACVTEKDIEAIAIGQPVSFYLDGGGSQTIAGHVSEVSRIPIDDVPKSLSVAGLVTGKPTSGGLVPVETSYFVIILPDKESGVAPHALYSVGRVRIGIRKSSLLQRFSRFLRQTF